MNSTIGKTLASPVSPSRGAFPASLLLATLVAALPARSADADGEQFFETHIRPLLSARCLECHGPEKQEMSVRFDSGDAVRRGGDSGPLLNLDKPEESLLLTVLSQGGDIKMPPDEKLPDDQIALVREWIARGAPWPASANEMKQVPVEERGKDHWAFQPIARPALPPVSPAAESPVDAFLLEKLAHHSLGFAPRADRRTLLRRATYDLIGLPPTMEEIDAFAEDEHPDAFSRATDRLLASPHYGERWGRHWLDIARYSDTKGYVFVSERRYPFAYTFRDYVIRSFNEDKPYRQFLLEQLAADKLPQGEDKSSLAGMGYLTVGRRFLNNGHDIIDDRIDVVTRGMLGLSVTCARCHDHKYDPVTMADYYSLYGVFQSSVEPDNRPVIGESESSELFASFRQELSQRQQAVDAYLERKRVEKEGVLRQKLPELVVTWHETGGNSDDPRVKETCQAINVNESLAKRFLERWRDYITPRLTPDNRVFGLWALFVAAPNTDFATTSADITARLEREPGMAAAYEPAIVDRFKSSPPADMKEVIQRYAQALVHGEESVRRVLDEPGSPLKLTREDAMACFDQGERNQLTDLRNKIEETRALHQGAPPEPMLMVDAETPRDSPVFLRGNPSRPGDPVPRRFIGFLDTPDRPPFQDGSGRRELAEKIVAPENPLTRRVIANRVWHWHFGRGIVRTTSDFGLRTEEPEHRPLLDYLAAEMLDTDWSIKSIHRLILESAAFQQSSADREEGRAVDPENELLWSFRRRRFDLEEMRDSMLDVTGELDERLLGRSVDIVNANGSTRRAVYAYVDRQNLEGFFRTFDFANPNTSVPFRFVTTVPQQALFLMNSPFVLARARALAFEPEGEAFPSVEHRIDALYRQILRRSASPKDLAAGKAFLLSASGEIPKPPSWQYGTGSVDPSSGQTVGFQPLTIFRDEQWRPSEKFPDPTAGHLILSANGGHPGQSPHYCAVRRWTAPAPMALQISGALEHPADKGDGVEGLIISSRHGILGRWTVKKSGAETTLPTRTVEEGETIDFVVSPGENQSYDGFRWSVKIEPMTLIAEGPSSWDSKRDFAGPTVPLSPWEKYAQVLLLTNEFSFID